MEHRQDNIQPVIDPAKYGVSFSLKQCRNFGLDPVETLQWLLGIGWRRFRLMSYWDEHEPEQGHEDFAWLDWQIATIAAAGGTVTLAIGAKQPRWPEYHWPKWTDKLDKTDRDSALLHYVGTVVARYRGVTAVVSWQLENEALLKGFGENIDIDRSRLRAEHQVVKKLDVERPVIMSTSNGWGIPVRRPRPDIVGFSCYFRLYSHGSYHTTIQSAWLHRLRTHFVHILLGKQVFIHELQCEPWGPTAIWKMDKTEQDKSMSAEQIRSNIASAKSIGAYPVDLWGGEWWCARAIQGDPSIWQAVKAEINT